MLKVRAGKIERIGFGHRVSFKEPLKANGRKIRAWYFLDLAGSDVREGDLLKYGTSLKGLYFMGVDKNFRKTN